MSADSPDRPGYASRPPPRPRFSPAVAVFVLAAVAFGAAASLLAAPVVPPPPPVTGASAGTPGGVVIAIIELIAFLIIAVAGWRISLMMRDRVPYPRTALGGILIIFVVAIAFLVLLRVFGHGGGGSGVLAPPPTNGSGTPPSSGGGPNGTGTGLGQPIEGTGIPQWVEYVAVLAAGVVAAVVIAPYLIASHRYREGLRRAPGAVPSARSTIGQALQGLDADPSADPRTRIIAAYARLLGRIEGSAIDLSTLTPREIERECTFKLGVTPATSHELTTLFEEARYSPHPIGPKAVDRARSALQRALTDLDRPPAGAA